MKATIITILFIVFMGISSVFMFAICLVVWLTTILFDRKLLLLHYITCFWGSMYLRIVPSWKIKVEGREKIVSKSYVMVSNHQSQLDILLVYNLFKPFKWVSKTAVFRIPFIGWNMRLNQYISLRRGSLSSIKKMLKDCEKSIRKGNSVFIFPEGTRSETGKMRKFRTGAFYLAKKMKTSILPVAITGTRNALPKGTFKYIGVQNIKLKVLDEIHYEQFCEMSPEKIGVMVRNILLKEIS